MLGKMSSVATIVEKLRKRSVRVTFSLSSQFHLTIFAYFWTDYKLRNYRVCSRSDSSLGSRMVIHWYAPPWCEFSE